MEYGDDVHDDRKEVKDTEEDQQKKKQHYDMKDFRINDGETTRRMRESLSGQSEDCLSIHGGLYTQMSVFVPICTLVRAHLSNLISVDGINLQGPF